MMIGEAIGVGKRLLSTNGIRTAASTARFRGAAFAGAIRRSNILSTQMSMGGLRGYMGTPAMRAARSALGRPTLMGMGIGAGLGIAGNTYGNMRSGRGAFSGTLSAGMGGAMRGGMIGAGVGAGGFLMGSKNRAWGAFSGM